MYLYPVSFPTMLEIIEELKRHMILLEKENERLRGINTKFTHNEYLKTFADRL